MFVFAKHYQLSDHAFHLLKDLLADYMCTCLTGFTGKDCGDMNEGIDLSFQLYRVNRLSYGGCYNFTFPIGSQSGSTAVSAELAGGVAGGVAVVLIIGIVVSLASAIG